MIQYLSPVVRFAFFFVLSTHYVLFAHGMTLELRPTRPLIDQAVAVKCKHPNSAKIHIVVYNSPKETYVLQMFTYNVQQNELSHGPGAWRSRSEVKFVKIHKVGFTIQFTLRESDAVRFQCLAEPSGELDSLDLTVHQRPQVLHLSMEHLSNKWGKTLTAGDNVTFKCEIMLGMPRTIDDEFLVPGEPFNPEDTVTDTESEDSYGYTTKTMIRKRTLTVRDNFASVKCSAGNLAGKASCEHKIKVSIPVKDVAIQQVTDSIVECSARGHPAPGITLKVVGNDVSDWQNPTIAGTRFVKLQAPEQAIGKSYEFNCVASNVINGETFEKSTTKTILIKGVIRKPSTPSTETTPAPAPKMMEYADISSKDLAAQKATSGGTAGAVIGAVCGVAVLAIVVLFVVRLVRKKKS